MFLIPPPPPPPKKKEEKKRQTDRLKTENASGLFVFMLPIMVCNEHCKRPTLE